MRSASLFLVCCLIAKGLAKSAVFLSYQDSLGQYSFGYSAPGSARSEVRTSNGATRGTYSYIDGTGVIQTAQYVADGENGFQVTATNLPQAPLPVQDTPEVMAARTAHLQALEMAARREEEIQSREKNIDNNALLKEISEKQAALNKEREQPETESAENVSKEEELTPKANVESRRNSESENDGKSKEESMQAVASQSGVDKEGRKSSQVISEEITADANILAIPLISSHVPPQALNQHALPIFRVSHADHTIEPPTAPESWNAQGCRISAAEDHLRSPSRIATAASGVITPAGTIILKSGTISTRIAEAPEKKQTQEVNKQAEAVSTLIAPLPTIPLSSSHSNFIRLVSPTSLHYVTYNVL